MGVQQNRRQIVLAILLAAAGLDARAEVFSYHGEVQVSAMSGVNCPASHSLTLPVTLSVRDDVQPERYEGYLVSANGVSRIAGSRLDDLVGTTPDKDPTLETRARVSLGGLGPDAVAGEARAESVPEKTPGCYLDKAAIKLVRVADPHSAESFKLARDQFGVYSLFAQWQALSATKDNVHALAVAREALKLAQQSYGPAEPAVRTALAIEIKTLFALGQAADTEPLLRRMIAMDEQAHQSKGPELADSLASLGVVLRMKRQYDEAQKLLRRAFELEGQTPDHRADIVSQLWQVKNANAVDRYRDMEVVLRDEVASSATDPAKLSLALFALGELLQKTGRYPEAEPVLRRSLAIGENQLGPDDPKLGPVLGELGSMLTETGRYAEAQILLRRAVLLAEKSKHDEELAIYLLDLSDSVQAVGRYAESEALARRALDVNEHLSPANQRNVAKAKVRLAEVLQSTDRYSEAEPYRRQVLEAYEKLVGPDDPDFAVVLSGLAATLVAEQKFQEAEPILRRSLAISTTVLGPESSRLVQPSTELAAVLRATGRYAEAQTTLERAYQLASTSEAAWAWRPASRLMNLYRDPHVAQPAIAVYYGKRAVNKLQGLRGNLGGSDSEQSFVEKVAPIYRALAALLIQQGRLSEAQQVLAMLKEQELYNFTARGATADTRKTSVDLNEAEQKLAAQDDELVSLEKEALPLRLKLRADRQLSAADKTSLDGIEAKLQVDQKIFQTEVKVVENSSDRQLDDLAGQYVALGKEYGALQDKFKKAGSLEPVDRARLQELRAAMDTAQATFDARASAVAKSSSDPEAQKRRKQEINDFSRAFEGTLKDMGHDAVLAQYFILDDRVSILVTTPNAVVAREAMIQRAQLNELILSFRKTLSNPNLDPEIQAEVLYRLLIAPIAADLRQAGAKTLMLDLDDTLRYLPFAALNDGKHYLIEDMALVMVTEAVRDKLAKQPGETPWTVWGLGLTKAGPGYDALPYAGVELNGIAGQQGVLTGKVMLDKAFTEVALRDGLDQSYPIVHIASHFQFTPGSMDDSFLLLGDGSHMTLAQIRNKLNFNSVELLTLSACETALGDDSVAHHGVEVEGLGALAQQAGAKAVLATLWPVADESTAALMRALYEAHKVDHLDKAEALRHAQLALLRGTVKADAGAAQRRGLTRKDQSAATADFKTDANAPFAHPFYWAPFILMGNWL
jgi:CHAT domain-containing protein